MEKEIFGLAPQRGNPASDWLKQEKHRLNEGLIRSYPIHVTVNYILKFMGSLVYKIYPIQENPYQICVVINDKYKKVLQDSMYHCGYHLDYEGNSFIDNDTKQRLTRFYYVMKFIPNKYVNNLQYMYHWTPLYLLDKIKKQGLKPTSKNNLYSYPARIYLLTSECTYNDMYNLGQDLCYNNDNERNDGWYVLLRIQVNKINNPNFELHTDSNFPIGGYYTYDNIPPEAIISAEYKNFYDDNNFLKPPIK